MIRLCRRVQSLSGQAKGRLQDAHVARKSWGSEHVRRAFELRITSCLQVAVHGISAFFAAPLRRKHTQVGAPEPGWKQSVIKKHRDDMIDGLGRSLRKNRRKVLR